MSRPQQSALRDGPRRLGDLARRIDVTARNTAEWLRYGGFETGEESSPFEVRSERGMYRLRRYFSDQAADDWKPLILVPPIMFTAEVWDVAPSTSAVRALHDRGVDVWVVDFGRPEKEPGGLSRSVTDHVVALGEALETVRELTGKEVILAGYSQGGTFAYQTAAYRRGDGIDSIITFGAPVDTRAPLPIPISPESAAQIAQHIVDTGLAKHISPPGWATRSFFKLLNPVRTAQGRLAFIKQLHDREALLPRERQRRFLDSEGFTAYPGAALADLLEQVVAQNRMLEGGFVIGDRLVTLADIDRPVLTFVGEGDAICHPHSVRAIDRAAPRADIYEVTLKCGHFGLVGGSSANRHTWPNVAEWVRWRSGAGDRPTAALPASDVSSTTLPTPGSVSQSIERVLDLALGTAQSLVGVASAATGTVTGLAREGLAQAPKLVRLQQMESQTQVSLGLLLDEAASHHPEHVFLLFGDRAVRHVEFKNRVDSVVKGLLGLGVRHGDRIGVLMGSRPSSLSVLAAISRLGATAVLLRPGGDIEAEARLGEISWMISDPEHVESRKELQDVTWCVIGGGAAPRELPSWVIDMERIDPTEVVVPLWYRPNPQKAADTAFILFAGSEDSTRPLAISNRRWAMSALGTASAAGMKPGDTVYSVTPLHHSSALLMALGGAVAAGARFAFASRRDPQTFWEEVRRYGATHVTYTWSSLSGVALGEAQPGEAHNSIRIFMGSGMPRNLWNTVTERFAPARVLEFYAAVDSEVILANVSTTKPGSMGRPVPGTARVKVAAYDLENRRLAIGSDGLGYEADKGEVGLLVVRHDPVRFPGKAPLRSVFRPYDAWQSTGDLFSQDADGDLWLMGPISEVISTAEGPVLPSRSRHALEAIPAVDLAVVYAGEHGEHGEVVATVTLRPGHNLTAKELTSSMRLLEPSHRPRVVQLVSNMPTTTWSRPNWRALTDPASESDGTLQSWRLDNSRKSYRSVAIRRTS